MICKDDLKLLEVFFGVKFCEAVWESPNLSFPVISHPTLIIGGLFTAQVALVLGTSNPQVNGQLEYSASWGQLEFLVFTDAHR